jgi:5-methylcytosine-specific restriction protein A
VFCRDAGRVTPASVVDHVVSIEESPRRAFDPSNLQSLCKSCHDGAKAGEEASGYARGCSADGTPLWVETERGSS